MDVTCIFKSDANKNEIQVITDDNGTKKITTYTNGTQEGDLTNKTYSIQMAIQALKDPAGFESLTLSGTISTLNIDPLVTFLRGNPRIKKIRFTDLKISADDFCKICASLRVNTELTQIKLETLDVTLPGGWNKNSIAQVLRDNYWMFIEEVCETITTSGGQISKVFHTLYMKGCKNKAGQPFSIAEQNVFLHALPSATVEDYQLARKICEVRAFGEGYEISEVLDKHTEHFNKLDRAQSTEDLANAVNVLTGSAIENHSRVLFCRQMVLLGGCGRTSVKNVIEAVNSQINTISVGQKDLEIAAAVTAFEEKPSASTLEKVRDALCLQRKMADLAKSFPVIFSATSNPNATSLQKVKTILGNMPPVEQQQSNDNNNNNNNNNNNRHH